MAEVTNSLPGEVWKPISGWEDRYEVSSFGRIKSLPFTLELMTRWGAMTTRHTQEKILAPQITPNGYELAHFKRGGVRKALYVHRLVCEAFHGAAQAGQEVAHGDGCRTNNKSDNLRWATSAENSGDMVRHGTTIRGNRHPTRKLDEAAVREIRATNDGEQDEAFAGRFGVKRNTIRLVRLGHCWKWMN